MKRKELKNLAEKIVKLELTIQNSNVKEEISKAKEEIMKLSGSIDSFEDMIALDDYIQDRITQGLDK